MIYSHYPSTHLVEPDLRNRRGRERAQAFERRYWELVRAGRYADQFKVQPVPSSR